MSKFSPKDVDRFTTGDCHILARAIHKRTGWPIRCCKDGGGGPNYHAWVEMPNGKALDIMGVATHKELAKEYGGSSAITESFDWDHIRGEWGGPIYGKYSYDRARKLAPVVLDTYAKEFISSK